MNPQILIPIWILIMAALQGSFLRPDPKEPDGSSNKLKVSLAFAIIVVLPLIWFAGSRNFFHGDTSTYYHHFEKLPDTLSGISDAIKNANKDQGFEVLSVLIKSLIGKSRKAFFMPIAFTQLFLLAITYRKYSINYMFSIALFVLSADYYGWMYNGIRQFLAVTIILAATPLLFNKKYIKLILVILLASTIHQSALIMIPLMFVAKGKAWNKKTVLLLLLSILIVSSAGEFLDFMDDSLQTTQYAGEMNAIREVGDDGTHPLRVLIFSVPAIISFVFRNKIKEQDDQFANFFTNTSIATAGLYLISMFTSGGIFGRIPIYVSIYNYILLPWEIDKCFDESRKNLMIGITLVLYLAFYYYQMHIIYGAF